MNTRQSISSRPKPEPQLSSRIESIVGYGFFVIQTKTEGRVRRIFWQYLNPAHKKVIEGVYQTDAGFTPVVDKHRRGVEPLENEAEFEYELQLFVVGISQSMTSISH